MKTDIHYRRKMHQCNNIERIQMCEKKRNVFLKIGTRIVGQQEKTGFILYRVT